MTLGLTTVAAAVVTVVAVMFALVGYWLVVIGEGAYLGPRAVRWLYDRGAPTYDRAKRFDSHDEAASLANPLVERIASSADAAPLVLDVATGTARLPVALLGLPFFEGDVVGVDLSGGMLREAAARTTAWRGRCHLLTGSACELPFADGAFDAVTMLEALEFTPDRHRALREAVRVLAPGGWLLVSNRVGIDRYLLPGRVDSPEAFERRLSVLGLRDVRTTEWQSYYDLVWGRKAADEGSAAGVRAGGPAADAASARTLRAWHAALACPHCGSVGAWRQGGVRLACGVCGGAYTLRDGIWEFDLGLPR